MELHILDFIKEHADWETLLTEKPYCVTTKWDGDYFLLKYNQFGSDFSNPIVKECRGSIFYKDPEKNEIKCVCMPFFKFGNYGETYADKIDWSTAKVMEKVDGSLIKIWYHNGWHISTNGNINAYNTQNAAYENMTFGNVVDLALGGRTEEFLDLINKDFIHMFELVSPYTRVTIPYSETRLYYLSSRSTTTMQEYVFKIPKQLDEFGLKLPRTYPLSTLAQCVNATNQMTKDEEGFVVVDARYRRIKIKSPEYLLASRARNNGAITTRTVLELMRENKIDDFLGYCPDYKDFVDKVLNAYKQLRDDMETQWRAYDAQTTNWSKKDFAIFVKNCTYKGYLFRRFDNKVTNAEEYLQSLCLSTLINLVKTIQND